MPEPLLYSSSRIPSRNLSRFHIVNGMSKELTKKTKQSIYTLAGLNRSDTGRGVTDGYLCAGKGIAFRNAFPQAWMRPLHQQSDCRSRQRSRACDDCYKAAPPIRVPLPTLPGQNFAPCSPGCSPPNGLMRWIVRWRRWFCFLLNFVRLARPDCEHCNQYVECWGTDMRKRLDELRRLASLTFFSPEKSKAGSGICSGPGLERIKLGKSNCQF